MPDNLDSTLGFNWFPLPPQQVTAPIDSVHGIWYPDYTLWDVYRIDMCSLVLNYDVVDGNTSAELCLGDSLDPTVSGPFLSVAAAPTVDWPPIGITEYLNKVHNQTETAFYITGYTAIYLRGESQATGASTMTGTVFSSAARMPDS